ncbi:MAG: hypothetical protein AB8G17_10220 [Gammaproteobacteria bacterium]
MKATLCILALVGLAKIAGAGEALEPTARQVIGPSNPDLVDGASQLKFGDPELGIRLTQRALLSAADIKEQYTAYSNLCAGYILVRKLDEAIRYCDLALKLNERSHQALSNRALARFYQDDFVRARDDVDAGLAVAPYSRSLKRVGQMIEDKVNPVAPMITIEHGEGRDAQ